jgi:hypothetical protein
MYSMDKFQISINPKLKNINNPNEDVLNVPISILFGNPILNWWGGRQIKIYDPETADYTGSAM